MFLLTPKSLSYGKEEIFSFGDPNKLKEGVKLKEKKNEKKKIIYSLYDLEINVKYISEQGHIIQRISDKKICIKRKSKSFNNINSQLENLNVEVKRSLPINIPDNISGLPIKSNSKKENQKLSFLNNNNNNNNNEIYHSESFSHNLSKNYTTSDSESFSFDNQTEDSNSLKEESPRMAVSFEEFDGFGKSTFIKISPKNMISSNNETIGTFKIILEIPTPHIPGEKLQQIIENVTLIRYSSKNIEGTLFLTNFQLIFLPNHQIEQYNKSIEQNVREYSFSKFDIIMIPLTTIARFEKVDKQNTHFMFGGENSYSFDIFTKDFRRSLRFALNPNYHSREMICTHLSRFIFPQSLNDIFAISSKQFESDYDPFNGWNLFNPLEEFERLGITKDNQWRISTINENYGLCDSYPKLLIVPQSITDKELQEISLFRSKSRIPVLTWRNIHTRVSLIRCSQPKTGISRSYRCIADENLLQAIQKTNPHSNKLHILDARPLTNAVANMALGGGYENLSFYQDCHLEFMGVANIHVVRDSWNKLQELCIASTIQYTEGEICKNINYFWLSQLESTHWLDHLSSIIAGAVKVVELIDIKKESVLIHCSDGWDRTSQICSLAQLLLDKYFRTIKGFCILIEKCWLHFGHKFADRLGLNFLDTTYKDGERSPIFFQFIDAVWQITQQFPDSFEFSEELLITIMDNSLSSRFGTFLFNSQKERDENELSKKSLSLWTFIFSNKSQYLNPFYNPNKEPFILYPNVDVKNMIFWKSCYLRFLTDNQLEYKNHYLQLGREFQSNIEQLKFEIEKVKKENEELKKKLVSSDINDWVDMKKTNHSQIINDKIIRESEITNSLNNIKITNLSTKK